MSVEDIFPLLLIYRKTHLYLNDNIAFHDSKDKEAASGNIDHPLLDNPANFD
jgi:hypothetical protein